MGLLGHISQSVQSLSHVQKFVTSWTTAMDYARLPVHHQLPELTQTHVHQVSDTIQLSHPLLSFSSWLQSFLASGSFLKSQFFASGGQSIEALASAWILLAWILFTLQWILGLISFRIDWFDLLAVQGTLKSLLQHHNSKHQSLAFSFLYGPTLTSIHEHWKNHSFH